MVVHCPKKTLRKRTKPEGGKETKQKVGVGGVGDVDLPASSLSKRNWLAAQIMPRDLSTKTVVTTAATRSSSAIQKAQQIHVRWRSFRFCRTSHESLCEASAVMVVTNLKREEGRPLREREMAEMFGARKKGRKGEEGGLEARWWMRGGGSRGEWCGEHVVVGDDEVDEEAVGGSLMFEPVKFGRRRGFVEGVFWRVERRKALLLRFYFAGGFDLSSASEKEISAERGESELVMVEPESEARWTMGGCPGEDIGKCICDRGDPRDNGTGVKEELLATYGCFGL